MWIFIITFTLICLIIFFRHGIEIVFNVYESNYEFGLFIIMFDKFRAFEIKKFNFEKFKKNEKKKKRKKQDFGFLKYVNAKIDVDYSIATLKLDPSNAYLYTSFCSLLECVDTLTSIQITQNIRYQYQGVNFDVKLRASIFNIIYAFAKYKILQLA